MLRKRKTIFCFPDTLGLAPVQFIATRGTVLLLFFYHWLINIPWPWEAVHGISMMQDVGGYAAALVLAVVFGGTYLTDVNLTTRVFADEQPGVRSLD